MKSGLNDSVTPSENEKQVAAGGLTFSALEAASLKTEIAAVRRKKKPGVLVFLSGRLNCTKETARLVLADLYRTSPPETAQSSQAGVMNMDGYSYNSITDKYVVPLTTYGRDYVCTGSQHRAMLTAYSNWGGDERSINEVARLYKMRRDWVREYFKLMRWTHDTMPVTHEELAQDKGKEAIQRIMDTRKAIVAQELQHADWNLTQDDAMKWRMMCAGSLDPFVNALASFKPEPVEPVKYSGSRNMSKDIFLIGLSDLHFGGLAKASELFKGQDFNAEKIKNVVDLYAVKIAADLAERKVSYSEGVICSLGDILHTLTGETVKGTPLESDVLREEQFELALNSLCRFIARIMELFPKVTVYAVKGNHAGAGDYILFKTLQAYFRTDPRIQFNLFKSRQACFKVGGAAVLMDHGASDIGKSVIPTNGSGKEAYIQNLFMQYPEVLVGTKCRLMLQGDRHRFMCEELRGFEHIIMGSCVTGDRYADNLGLHSRARQNCLVLSEDGVKEVLSFYFD